MQASEKKDVRKRILRSTTTKGESYIYPLLGFLQRKYIIWRLRTNCFFAGEA